MIRHTQQSATKKGPQLTAGLFLYLLLSISLASEYLLPPERFLAQAFPKGTPEADSVWLTGEHGNAVSSILGHKPPSLRVRYWQHETRTAWILEEIGKEKPITAGFVIEDGKLVNVEVLAFRETRGWEIEHDFFTKQFDGVELSAGHQLSASIDNITGATLSVNAMRRMARVALFLDSELRNVAP